MQSSEVGKRGACWSACGCRWIAMKPSCPCDLPCVLVIYTEARESCRLSAADGAVCSRASGIKHCGGRQPPTLDLRFCGLVYPSPVGIETVIGKSVDLNAGCVFHFCLPPISLMYSAVFLFGLVAVREKRGGGGGFSCVVLFVVDTYSWQWHGPPLWMFASHGKPEVLSCVDSVPYCAMLCVLSAYLRCTFVCMYTSFVIHFFFLFFFLPSTVCLLFSHVLTVITAAVAQFCFVRFRGYCSTQPCPEFHFLAFIV